MQYQNSPEVNCPLIDAATTYSDTQSRAYSYDVDGAQYAYAYSCSEATGTAHSSCKNAKDQTKTATIFDSDGQSVEKDLQVWQGIVNEYQECVYPCNPSWTAWSEWSLCRASCNGGFARRVRDCSGGFTRDCKAKQEADKQFVTPIGHACSLNQDVIDHFSETGLDDSEYLDRIKYKWGNTWYNLNAGTKAEEFGTQDDGSYYAKYGKYQYYPSTNEWAFIEDSNQLSHSADSSLFIQAGFYDSLIQCSISDFRTINLGFKKPTDGTKGALGWVKKFEELGASATTDEVVAAKLYTDKYKFDYRVCAYKACDEDNYQWSEWTEPTSCSKTCTQCTWDAANNRKTCDNNAAYALRYRSCRKVGQSPQDDTEYNQCPPDEVNGWKVGKYKSEPCEIPECVYVHHWTDWSSCSRTCGGGYRKRTRLCNYDIASKCESEKTANGQWSVCQTIATKEKYLNQDYYLNAKVGKDLIPRTLYTDYPTKYDISSCKSPKTGNTWATPTTSETEACNLEQCYHEPLIAPGLGMEFHLYATPQQYEAAIADLELHGQVMAFLTDEVVGFLAGKEKDGQIDTGTMLWNAITLSAANGEGDDPATPYWNDAFDEPIYQYHINDYWRIKDLLQKPGYNKMFDHYGTQTTLLGTDSDSNSTKSYTEFQHLIYDDPSNPNDASGLRECSTVIIEDSTEDETGKSVGGTSTHVKCDQYFSYMGMRPIYQSVASYKAATNTQFLFPIAYGNDDATSLSHIFTPTRHDVATATSYFDGRYMMSIAQLAEPRKSDKEFVHTQLLTINLEFAGEIKSFWITEKWSSEFSEDSNGDRVNFNSLHFAVPSNTTQTEYCEANSDETCCLSAMANAYLVETPLVLSFRHCEESEYAMFYELLPTLFEQQTEQESVNDYGAGWFSDTFRMTQPSYIRFVERSGAIPVIFENQFSLDRLVSAVTAEKFTELTTDVDFWLGLELQMGETNNDGVFGLFSEYSSVDLYAYDGHSYNNDANLMQKYNETDHPSIDMLKDLIPVENQGENLKMILDEVFYNETLPIEFIQFDRCLYISVDKSVSPYTWKIDTNKCRGSADNLQRYPLGFFPKAVPGDTEIPGIQFSGLSYEDFKEKTGHELFHGGEIMGHIEEMESIIHKNIYYFTLLDNGDKVYPRKFIPEKKMFESGFVSSIFSNYSREFYDYPSYWVALQYDHEHKLYFSDVAGRQTYKTLERWIEYMGADYIQWEIEDIRGDCLVLTVNTESNDAHQFTMRTADCDGDRHGMIFSVGSLRHEHLPASDYPGFVLAYTPNSVNLDTAGYWFYKNMNEWSFEKSGGKVFEWLPPRMFGPFSNPRLLNALRELTDDNNLETESHDYIDAKGKYHHDEASDIWFDLMFDKDWICSMNFTDTDGDFDFNSQTGTGQQCSYSTMKTDEKNRQFNYDLYDVEDLSKINDEEVERLIKGIVTDEELTSIGHERIRTVIIELSQTKPCSIINNDGLQILATTCNTTSNLISSGNWVWWKLGYSWNYVQLSDALIDPHPRRIPQLEVNLWLSTGSFIVKHFPDRLERCSLAHLDEDSHVIIERTACFLQDCREDLVKTGEKFTNFGQNKTQNIEEMFMICGPIGSVKTVAETVGTVLEDLHTVGSFLFVKDMPKVEVVDFGDHADAPLTRISTEYNLNDMVALLREYNTHHNHSDDAVANLLAARTEDEWTELSTNSYGFEVGSIFWYGLEFIDDTRTFYYIDINQDFSIGNSTDRKIVQSTEGITATGDFRGKGNHCTVLAVTSNITAEIQSADCMFQKAQIAFIEYGELEDISSYGFSTDASYSLAVSYDDFDSQLEVISTAASATDAFDLDFDSSRRRKRHVSKSRSKRDTESRLVLYHADSDAVDELVGWVSDGTLSLPDGASEENRFWYGLKWDSDLMRYKHSSSAITDSNVYEDTRLPWDSAGQQFSGVTWVEADNRYELDDETMLCIMLVVDETIDEDEETDYSEQVWLETVDCDDEAYTMSYIPEDEPDQEYLAYILHHSYEVDNGIDQWTNGSIILVEPFAVSADDVLTQIQSCESDNSTCVTFDATYVEYLQSVTSYTTSIALSSAMTTHVFVLEEDTISMMKEELDEGNLPNGYFWIGVMYDNETEKYIYLEELSEKHSVLDMHLLPIEDPVSSDKLCVMLHINETASVYSMGLLHNDCAASTYTDSYDTEWSVYSMRTVDRDHDIPTQEETEICSEDDYAYGHISGDPHFKTFDGLTFSYQGQCQYIIAELCEYTWNKDYEQLASDVFPYFQVVSFQRLSNSDSDMSAYVSGIKITYRAVNSTDTFEYQIYNDWNAVQVRKNNEGAYINLRSETDYSDSQDLVLSGNRNNFYFSLFSGKIVIHFQYRAVTVKLSCDFERTADPLGIKVCGLLGNFDKNQYDDSYVKGQATSTNCASDDCGVPDWAGSGMTTAEEAEFGDSWVYEGVDVETCTAETNLDDVIENCESNSTQYDEIEVYCHEKIEILKSDFNTNNCFSFDFANFHSCVLDLCSQIDAGVEVFQERKGKIVCSTLQAIDS